MISFFRKALTSWLALGLFALILIAFVITGFGAPTGLESMALGGNKVATVGSEGIEAGDVAAGVQRAYEQERQQNPALTMSQFVQGGAVEKEIERLILEKSIDQFMGDEGVVISRRLVDRELNKITRFHGPTGKFDPVQFQAALQENKLTEADVRQQFARQIFARTIEVPAGAAAFPPESVALSYGAVQLESRSGQIATISAADFAGGAAPTEAELKTYYASNAARYTLPETRVIRYAMISPSRFAGKATPSEAEIAAAYKANAPRFAASETRVLTQAILPSAEAAKVLVKAAEASNFADAAKVAGVKPTTLKPLDKPGFAAIATAPAVADAAFGAGEGMIVDAGKSPLGWHVVRVDSVIKKGGKTLDQARAELLPDLIKRKEAAALQDFIGKVEEAVDDGQTMADVAKAMGLSVVETPAVTASGMAPDARGFAFPAPLAPVLKEAFQAEIGDEPLVGALESQNGESALYELGAVNPAAPKPLAAIRAQVEQDFNMERGAKAAKKAANAVLAKVNKGQPLAAALASEKLGSARPLSGKRTQLQGDPATLPAGLEALFELGRGKARLTELPGKSGYAIVALDRITPGNPTSDPQLMSVLVQQLMRQTSGEYVEQFFNAVSKPMGVERNADSIARLKRSLTNPGGQ